MKRRIVALLASGLVAGVIMLLPASPASAGTDVCVGQGTAATGQGLTYPFPGTGKNTTASFTFSVGACVGTSGVRTSAGIPAGLPTPFANVNISGLGVAPLNGAYCGHSTGSGGVADNHHSFQYVSAGSILLILPGGVGTNVAAGVVNASPDVTTTPPQSCLPTGPGASQFLITGAVALI
jgi:hypothetical protein